MQRRYGDLNYGRLTKLGVVAGAATFLLGALGEYGIHGVSLLPESLDSAFLAMEFLGPAVALLSICVFGVALPLTE